MNKKKAILVGISVVVGTVIVLFAAFVILMLILERADRYSRGY